MKTSSETMDFINKLKAARQKNNSLLCVGLDPDQSKIPAGTSYFEFNKNIVDATADLVCAYKPNIAFYEALGADGVLQLKQTADYIHENHPEIPVILDAKRADIGNTNEGYIKQIFDYLGMDAVTLHPYLGREALEPFLGNHDKGLIILCRTSNPGAGEFQDLSIDGKPLYEHVATQVATNWNDAGNCLLVVGATYPEEMQAIRQIVGDEMFFLVPGIGAQGGDIEATVKAGGENIIINSARDIIYNSDPRQRAAEVRDEINQYRGV